MTNPHDKADAGMAKPHDEAGGRERMGKLGAAVQKSVA